MAAGEKGQKRTRRRIVVTLVCLLVLLLLLLAPGRDGQRLFSAGLDVLDPEPELVDAALEGGSADRTPARKHLGIVDPDDVGDLAASGDKDHRANVRPVEEPTIDLDRNLPGGGLVAWPFGLQTLQAGAAGLLTENGSTPSFGRAAHDTFMPGGGGGAAGGYSGAATGGGTANGNVGNQGGGNDDNAGAGDGGNGEPSNPGAGGDGANARGGNPPAGEPGHPGNGGNNTGGAGGNNTGGSGGDLVFVPDRDLTGDSNDPNSSGSPGVNGTNLLKPSNDGFDGPGGGGGTGSNGDPLAPATVPEPATLTLLGSGLVILGRTLRRRRAATH